jgi:hypothetical protein
MVRAGISDNFSQTISIVAARKEKRERKQLWTDYQCKLFRILSTLIEDEGQYNRIKAKSGTVRVQ